MRHVKSVHFCELSNGRRQSTKSIVIQDHVRQQREISDPLRNGGERVVGESEPREGVSTCRELVRDAGDGVVADVEDLSRRELQSLGVSASFTGDKASSQTPPSGIRRLLALHRS